MKVGMLWFDNDPKADLAEKVKRAAEYYAKKYGRQPTLCVVHPSMKANGSQAGMEIKMDRKMPRNHLWMGIGE